MFITLLGVTFVIALIVAAIAARFFKSPIERILSSILAEDIGAAWTRYLMFAIYVVGISTGVRLHQLERYITADKASDTTIVLNLDRWILEIYRTIIGTLQGIAWMLLLFFIFALIAFVIVRLFESKKEKPTT